MVPKAGLEPARLAPLPPQDSVSTNSTTSAFDKKNVLPFAVLGVFFGRLLGDAGHFLGGPLVALLRQ